MRDSDDARSVPMPSAPPPGGSACGAEFYVAYRPMPRGLVRFVWRLAPALLTACGLLAWALARSQIDPGDGVWDDTVARAFVGRVEAMPYPHLRRLTGHPDRPCETLLLVEIGKFGGGQRARALDGRVARVSGWVLERDGRRMLEMEPGDALTAVDSLAAGQAAALDVVNVAFLGGVTLRGEIIDSKCYLGAMKPGEGKTHKQCATLCIQGGIPPMFVTLDAAGRRAYYLLVDPQGAPLDDRILPYVADPVEITGEWERRDDLHLLRIDPRRIRRL